MTLLVYLFLLFLSVVGLCEIIHFFSLAIFDSKKAKNKFMLCVLKDDCAELELQFVREQYSWLGRKYADKIYAVNLLDKQSAAYSRCSKYCEKHSIEIVRPEDVEIILLNGVIND